MHTNPKDNDRLILFNKLQFVISRHCVCVCVFWSFDYETRKSGIADVYDNVANNDEVNPMIRLGDLSRR